MAITKSVNWDFQVNLLHEYAKYWGWDTDRAILNDNEDGSFTFVLQKDRKTVFVGTYRRLAWLYKRLTKPKE